MFQQKWQIDDLQVLRHDSSIATLSMTALPNQFFQWFICTNPKARLCQRSKVHTVKRYVEKCSFKLTKCQDCIAFPSNYTRNKGFFLVSSSRKPVISLVSEYPCPGRRSPAHRRPPDCIHKQLQNQLPGIIVVWSHKIAGYIHFKVSESQNKEV